LPYLNVETLLGADGRVLVVNYIVCTVSCCLFLVTAQVETENKDLFGILTMSWLCVVLV